MEIKDVCKINDKLIPYLNVRSDIPKINSFNHDLIIANDMEFIKPELQTITFFNVIRKDWKEVEKFEFRHMDVEKTFDNMIKKARLI
ncbi:MAG: hypothetical protein ABIJ08_03425 [Nanoarchaeota archaeon]